MSDPAHDTLPPHAGPSDTALDGGGTPLSPFGQRVMAVAWPAFLMAGVLEMLVFAFADPAELHWLGGAPVELSRSAVYTVAFFLFWLVIATAGGLTQLLLSDPPGPEAGARRRSAPNWPA